MSIPLYVTLAAAALVSVLSAGHVLAQAAPEFAQAKAEPRRIAPALSVFERNAALAKTRQARYEKLCTIKPVMTDAEIDGCRQASRL
jgi:hypothetical protein